MRADWSPEFYLKFYSERTRAAADLLARVPLAQPKLVYDLGCGPGNSTALLLAAYPNAKVIGVDSSPAMLERARAETKGADYVQADLQSWLASPDADLLYSNATFQWLTGHAQTMARLVAGLRAGAVLAVQMPNNLSEPSHVLMRKVAGDGRWSERLKAAAAARELILAPSGYANLLQSWCSSMDIWQTTYYHRLAGHDAIVDFLTSTGLRPFLDPLNESEQAAFKDAYRKELEGAYQPLDDGSVLLPFPRLFIVACRRGAGA